MHVSDYADGGFLPLQDHGTDVDPEMRLQVRGMRVVAVPEPEENDVPTIEYGEDKDHGTLGDVHPWFFWQTRDVEERAMGSFAQCFASLVVGSTSTSPTGPITPSRGGWKPGDTSTATTAGGGTTASPPAPGGQVLPIKSGRVSVDGRYHEKYPGWPKCLGPVPQGTMMLTAPGTAESAQHEVMLHTDPRLVAPNVSGPGEAGTLVVDLQPSAELCMSGSATPGFDGRHARLQSAWRVIATDSIPLLGSAGNGIAWNHTVSGTDGIAGYGMMFGRIEGGVSGPITPRITPAPSPTGPITPGRGRGSGSSAAHIGGPGGVGDNGGEPPPLPGRGRHANDGDTPCDFGAFSPKPKHQHGVSFAAHLGACGPLHAGHIGDKHRIGTDKDGHPMTSSHIATQAYLYSNPAYDAPLEFINQPYPKVQDAPIKVPVYLYMDFSKSHKFIDGARQGLWRWWTVTNDCCPDDKEPNGDKTGDPRTPSGPDVPTPSGPGPTTPGPPGRPRPGGPTTPRGPGAPGGPNTGSPTAPPPIPPIDPKALAPFAPGPSGPITQPPGSIGEDHSDPRTKEWGDILEGGGGSGFGTATGGGGGSDELSAADARGPFTVGGIDGLSEEHVAAYQIYRPTMTGFSAMSFRPQQWREGAPSRIHAKWFDQDRLIYDESRIPNVLSMHVWGALDSTRGEWSYVEDPKTSRARGGTGHGGVLYTPPHLEPEDYFGIGSTKSDADLRTISTVSFVAAAPGVAFALGTPTLAGGMQSKSVVLGQTPTGNDPLTVYQIASDGTPKELFGGEVDQGTGEVVAGAGLGGAQCLRIPRGTTAQRPATLGKVGGLRVNSSGANDALEFWDEKGSVWTTAASGGVGTWLGLTDTDPASYSGQAGKFVRVNSTPSGLEFYDHEGAADPHPGYVLAAGDTVTGELSIVNTLGSQLLLGDNTTPITTKQGSIALRHYDTTEESVYLIGGASTSASNTIVIGGDGNVAGLNSATAIAFFASSDQITTNATERLRLEYDLFEAHVPLRLDDNKALQFGTGGDSTIAYDGTNTTWTPDAVGSGYLRINGDVGIDVAPSTNLHASGVIRADGGFSDGATSGIDATINFTDTGGTTHDVTVSGGLITEWTTS